MLDYNWSPTRLFATNLERDRMGVQLQLSNFSFFCNLTPTLHERQSGALKKLWAPDWNDSLDSSLNLTPLSPTTITNDGTPSINFLSFDLPLDEQNGLQWHFKQISSRMNE